MTEISRRGALATGAVTAASYSRVLGANETVRIAVIGVGARGFGHVRSLRNNKGVGVVGLCDVYGRRLEAAKQVVPEAATFSDHRKALEMKNLDAVFIATPDHWHVPIALDAIDAGKDVFCEKPITLKIGEGAALRKAVRAGRSVFQSGMQQRSMAHYKVARDEYVKAGKLGVVVFVRTWWHGSVGSFVKPVPPELQRLPADLDWKRYVAPVKWREYQPYQYNCFRAFLDFGGGQFTDLFTHWVDAAHMVMGEDVPAAASAVGGNWIPEYQRDGSGRTAPDTVSAHLTYPGGWTCTFDATLAAGIDSAGVEFYGTQGRLFITRSGFEFTPADQNAQAAFLMPRASRGGPRPMRPPAGRGGPPPGEPFSLQPRRDPNAVTVKGEGAVAPHIDNFLECIKTRKDPNATIEDGIRAALASHLCTLSYVQQRRIRLDPATQRPAG